MGMSASLAGIVIVFAVCFGVALGIMLIVLPTPAGRRRYGLLFGVPATVATICLIALAFLLRGTGR
jgi:hypothetical protein